MNPSPEDREAEGGLAERRRRLASIWGTLAAHRRVVITTHINPDGDGIGSEVAVAHRLQRVGGEPAIVNPTRHPEAFEFLLEGLDAFTIGQRAGREAAAGADLFLVLDTSERDRIGALAEHMEGKPVAVIDHHPPAGSALGDPAIRDPIACASGELVYDMLEGQGGDLTRREAEGLYVAIVTDTGSFRFSNTTARAHRITARLIAAGVRPESFYGALYGQLTRRRLALLHKAIEKLHVDPEGRVAWVSLRRADFAPLGVRSEDFDGLIEYPRRLRGVEVAFMLRELEDGRTKVSLRSNAGADVNRVAATLGGGGHAKAAGAVLDLALEEAETLVLESVHESLPAVGG